MEYKDIYCTDNTCGHNKRKCDECSYYIREGLTLDELFSKPSTRVGESAFFKGFVYSNRPFPFVHIKSISGDYLFNLSEGEIWEFYGYGDLTGEELVYMKNWIAKHKTAIKHCFKYVDKLARGEISDGDE